MKQELLEHLIRHCIREVLSQMNESVPEPTIGAAAPPADGLGTADQPAAPEKKTVSLEERPYQINENLQKLIKNVINEVLDGR